MTTFVIKIIALCWMVLDHIGLYFDGIPIWFRWLGRACYPLFLFCMVWGYHYTKNRKTYLLRLYLMSIFMTVLGYVLNELIVADPIYGNHNIFLSMFLVGVLISAIELFAKDRKKGAALLATIFIVQLLFYILPGFIPFLKELTGDMLTGIIPNLVACQYGFEFVALGVVMYFLRDKKAYFCAIYILFCIFQFTLEMQLYGVIDQCFMILALPIMMRYNHQKGYGMKYLFYIFYPAHTVLLFYFANYVF